MTPQQEQQLRLQAKARGYDKAKEDAYVEFVKNKSQVAQPQPVQQPQKTGFFDTLKGIGKQFGSDVKNSFNSRADKVGGILSSKDSLGSKALQVFGQGTAVASDTIGAGFMTAMRGAGAITPDSIEKPIVDTAQKGLTKVLESRPVQAGVGAYQGFKQNNPETARNLEAGANVLSLGADLAGGLLAKKGASTAVKSATPTITKTLSKGADKAVDIAGDASVKMTRKAVTQLERKYDEIFTGTKSAKKKFDLSTSRGKTPSKFLAENGLIVDVKGGKLETASTVEKIRANAQIYDDTLDDILKVKDAQLPDVNKVRLDDLANKAKQAISTEKNKASGYLQKQYQEIDNIIADIKASYGDAVNYSQLNEIKRGQWGQVKFDATRPSYASDIHYTIGNKAKETIEELIPEADIKQLNSYLGDHFDTIQNLIKVDGNAVRGGRLGNYFARTVGAVVGAQGGLIGSVAGAMGGDIVASILQNNFIAGPIKRIMLNKVMSQAGPGSPIYKAAQEALKRLQSNIKLLPAGNPGITNQPGVIRGSINVPPGGFKLTPDADELASKLKRVGGQGSRRHVLKETLKPGQISVPKIKRGSYKQTREMKAREFQRILKKKD